ncbi:MAG TPA: nitrite reductase small subunit NirD [Nocardia sp.]|uniref:nitrite reductase small subunit NirD n=1 Tax=Nocardia TaxID=1817 RepID=UPI002453755C|nr:MULTISPECIES: nitrite reductase small subunit NirD [Nocardia]HLS79448.1 nitrite reductase small subunit NirD [Nocardia sp.]
MTIIDSPSFVPSTVTGWTQACRLDYLIPGRGVAVLLRGGRQAALFLLSDGTLAAVGNIDPFGRAAVMSRGIVGDRGGIPVVASPLLKQAFSLIDGHCLDDGSAALPVYAVRVDDGIVSISNEPVTVESSDG